MDLERIKTTFLQLCGPHDCAVDSAPCTCAAEDYRPVMLDLVREVERLRAKEFGPHAELERERDALRVGLQTLYDSSTVEQPWVSPLALLSTVKGIRTLLDCTSITGE